jgi:hypothetical protein
MFRIGVEPKGAYARFYTGTHSEIHSEEGTPCSYRSSHAMRRVGLAGKAQCDIGLLLIRKGSWPGRPPPSNNNLSFDHGWRSSSMKRIDRNLFVRISDDESSEYLRFVYTVKCHEHLTFIPNRAINKSTSSRCRAEHLTCVVSTLLFRP